MLHALAKIVRCLPLGSTANAPAELRGRRRPDPIQSICQAFRASCGAQHPAYPGVPERLACQAGRRFPSRAVPHRGGTERCGYREVRPGRTKHRAGSTRPARGPPLSNGRRGKLGQSPQGGSRAGGIRGTIGQLRASQAAGRWPDIGALAFAAGGPGRGDAWRELVGRGHPAGLRCRRCCAGIFQERKPTLCGERAIGLWLPGGRTKNRWDPRDVHRRSARLVGSPGRGCPGLYSCGQGIADHAVGRAAPATTSRAHLTPSNSSLWTPWSVPTKRFTAARASKGQGESSSPTTEKPPPKLPNCH